MKIERMIHPNCSEWDELIEIEEDPDPFFDDEYQIKEEIKETIKVSDWEP